MTQLKLSQQAQIIEQIHDSIVTTDVDGKIISLNTSAKTLFDYQDDEIINKNIDTLFTQENYDLIKSYIKTLFEKQVYHTKIDFLSKVHEIVVADLTLSLLLDSDGKIIRIIYYIQDITNQERLNIEVKKQENIITSQAHYVSMGEMIGNIAHQWRQPLSVISTASSGMQVQKDLDILSDDLFQESCETINRNAQYLSNTIDDFRNFIKGDKIKSIFNLTNTVNSFMHLVASSIKSYHINVVLQLDDNIKIFGYENELIQCLMNIFNNASDVFEEKNQADRFILISTYLENSHSLVEENKNIVITIKDNAGGMEEDILVKIFEPYFTTKHQSQGTGLGLHMVYNLLVNGMRGTILAKNSNFEHKGNNYTGAEFIITLPQ